MTLQEKTNSAFVDHTVEVNKYAQSQKQRVLSEIAFVLNEIKKALSVGDKEVNVTEIRNMIREANRLFKSGMTLVRKNLYSDTDDFLAVEIAGQSEMLQKLLDEFNVGYSVREPNHRRTQKKIEEVPVENLSIPAWLDQWELKTRNIMDSALLSSQVETSNRNEIIDYVFGETKNPLQSNTFLRAGVDYGAIAVSLVDATATQVTTGIGNANPAIAIGETWNSCLCATTCARCASLHGAIRYYDGVDETDGASIPLHPNCLCHWTIVYRKANQMSASIARKDQKSINSDEKPPRFQVWYNSISKERQIDLFGKTRVNMLAKGDIKINQLLSRRNKRLYSLEELKSRGYRVSK